MFFHPHTPGSIRWRAFLVPVFFLICGSPLLAASASSTPDASSARNMTREDVEAFLDGLLPMQIQREDIAGAVVAIVKDGTVLMTKGYGYADVEKKKPVRPETTLFRPGSISKLFTWTAVMQLVEQGRIDLEKDINAYLDFPIPAYQGKPITMRNLLTHTPGFEESVKLLFVENPKSMVPLKAYLPEHLPARIFPPGAIPAYSNYGATLAGYIVERVSGEPFSQYVDRHILKVLGMHRTTFDQPLPDALRPLMSNGYALSRDGKKDFEYIQSFPAGSLSATADDMARFMLAHLQEGTGSGPFLLRPETFRFMHARAFQSSSLTNGMALGFYEESRNGHRIIGHGGDTLWFHSDLHLVPDQNLGFFVSYNSAGKGEVSPRSALWLQFLDRYYPYQPPAAGKTHPGPDEVSRILGRYISSRRSETNLFSLTQALGQTVVSSNADGTISVSDFKDFSGEPKKFERIGPLLFRQTGGQSLLAWKFAPDGSIEMAFDAPYQVFQKAGLLRNGLLHTSLIAGSLIIFLFTLISGPIAAMARRHYGKPLESGGGQKRRRRLIRLICAVDLFFVAALLASLSGNEPAMLFSQKLDIWIYGLQGIGWLGALGTPVILYCVLRSWLDPKLWLWAKVWNGFILLAGLGYAFFVFSWHLLRFNLNF